MVGALLNSTLWTHLDLAPKQLTHSDCLAFLKARLLRARKHRLYLSVWDDEIIDLNIYHGAGTLFASHSRIDTLHLCGNSTNRVTRILIEIVFRDDTPSTLISLSVETGNSDRVSRRSPNIDLVGRANSRTLPDLQSLSLAMTNFIPISLP